MATKFLSHQLLNSRRFALGRSEAESKGTEEQQIEDPASAELSNHSSQSDNQSQEPVAQSYSDDSQNQQQPRERPHAQNSSLENSLSNSQSHVTRDHPSSFSESSHEQRKTVQERPQDWREPEENSPHEENEDNLNVILSREEQATKQTALQRELLELHRQRREVMQRLQETRTSLEQEKEGIEAKVHFFSSLLEELRAFSDQDGEESMRGLRQAVNNAHMEWVKREQEKAAEAGGENFNRQTSHTLSSMSLAQLAKIGFGLLWPVLVALLVSGGIVAATLYKLFSL